MQLQLDFFAPIEEDDALNKTANELLELLNEDLKPKDLYKPTFYQQVNDIIVLIAHNREKHFVFNMVDLNGKIPSGFSVNWRNLQHIKQELKEYLPN